MTQPAMRPVDLPVAVPPASGARGRLAAFVGAGGLLAVGVGSIWLHVVADDRRIDGWRLGGLVAWVAWLTVGEAVRLRLGGPHRVRVHVAGFVGGAALGAAVGAAASAAGVAFVLGLPLAILVTIGGVLWLVVVGRSGEGRPAA